MGLMVLFVLGQALYLGRHLKDTDSAASAGTPPTAKDLRP